MKITKVSSLVYRQHLKSGSPKIKFAGEGRDTFETLLIKVETDDGIVGWGEAFPHRVWKAIPALVETLIAPVCIGADPTDISGLMKKLIYHVHGVGRAGPVMYAPVRPRHRAVGHSGQGGEPADLQAARRRAARTSRPTPAC